jgi:HAD superfamily hydrolase (TIGR01509 family)
MAIPVTPAAVHALIFDLDGLLVDSEPLAGASIVALMRRYDRDIRLDADLAKRVGGRRMIEVLTVIAELYDLDIAPERLLQELEDLRLEVIRGQLQPLPGAVELIAFGQAAGLPLALATSGVRRYVDAVLEETSLAGRFTVEVTGEDVTHGKPDPETFLVAAALLGVIPAHCVVFEDAPPGIAAAVAGGMRAVAVPNVHTRDLEFPVPPEVTLPDLRAAVPWLRAQGLSCRHTPSDPRGLINGAVSRRHGGNVTA